MTPEEIEAALEAAAAAPLIVESDGQKVQQHSLRDRLALADRAASAAALSGGKSGWGACRPARLVLPGATGHSSQTLDNPQDV